ncbi:MAG: SpoIID/LytB domain-containing protein [Solirubrobacterales bacterium]
MPSRVNLRARIVAPLILLAGLALTAPGAAAKGVTWELEGGGFGHGVGMSQYGAKGYAERGASWQEILAHYYTGTTIGRVEPYAVRVLLQSGVGSAAFSGVDAACGVRLIEDKTYSATTTDGETVRLNNPAGKKLADCGEVMTATGGPSWTLAGKGEYRGGLQVRPSASGGVDAIDWLPVEAYVRGVVGYESPSSWPIEALRAQAVAARSYALTTPVGDAGYDLYDDTRSQVYGGVAAEGPRTDKAVDSTSGLTVAHDGRVARTYFFSTSGGHTEDVENAFGGDPVPYLKGVADPYEAESSYHEWHRSLSEEQMQSALSGLVKGSLESIRVPERGSSPRIVKAELVGSEGTTEVSGSTLQSRLDLPDKWVFFRKRTPGRTESRYQAPWAL